MLDSVRLDIVLILTQDSCTVCAERTTGSARLVHLEIVLVSVQDWCIVWAKHTVGSEIILDAPDSTPR
jgi:hypothetical protein